MRFLSIEGETPYAAAREYQLRLVEERIADRIPDTVLFLEHRPVVTRGRGLQDNGTQRARHMPLGVLPEGVDFHDTERGGDLTYHGPGQLIVYPICRLDGSGFAPNREVAGYLRKLERVLIDELEEWGLTAESRETATGVWAEGRKVASIGVAVRKWVTYHGMAINCVNDLAPFQMFSPCGFSPEVMGNLRDLAEKKSPKVLAKLASAEWRKWLEQRLAARFVPNSQTESIRLPSIP